MVASENNDVEVLARSTSIKDALDILKGGTVLWKIRDKGVRGLKVYKRKYRLDLADLRINYVPNKSMAKKNCASGSGVSTAIDLADIAEVRAGHGTDTFNAMTKRSKDEMKKGPKQIFEHQVGDMDCGTELCFSLVFKDATPPLDLVAEDNNTRDLWVDVLSHLVVTIRSLGQQKEYELFLKKQFQNADKNGNGSLTLDECHDLIGQLNIKMPKEDIETLFRTANKNRAKQREVEALDEGEFVAFYYSLLKRPELDEVFIRYSTSSQGKGPRMSAEDFSKYMKEEQNVELVSEETHKIIEAFEPSEDRTSLSMEGFTHFMMFSEWQEITDVAHRKLVYQNMDHPLSHYWIASSHNTYLLGNQVTGESSVDAYIKALKEGCRCVELDCWDGDDGEPIIYHGWTLTSKILFKEVIADAIKAYAFFASDYPLILSIENHCSLEQQDVMADHLRTILGDLLYSAPVDESQNELPSPEKLKRKVLVKAKKLPAGSKQEDEIKDEDEVDDDERDEKKKKMAKKISQKLSELVNYIEAVHFHNFGKSKEEGKYFHMSSFGEAKAFKLIEDAENSVQFVKYNTRQISRIYPGAKRQDSSNLKVVPPWNAGCQIVALNYQTEDKQNFINRARFADNGGCGYVLKPVFLRYLTTKYSPVSPSGLDPSIYKHWKIDITVVSGQHIPRPSGRLEGEVIDPYVKVRLRGHPDDEREEDVNVDGQIKKKNKGKTQPVSNNGFNPVWKESFTFTSVVPDLAFLEFKVKDHSKSGTDKDIGAFCCPLTMIQQGYRRVCLKDYTGKDLSPASLLVHIKITKLES